MAICRDAAADMREFELRYKHELNIVVDESAPHFPQWLKVFLLMMKEASKVFDCCIICSADETDLGHAEDFQRVLNSQSFSTCLLQTSKLGPGLVLDEVQEMLDGSTVVFLFCTPSLMMDRGIAKLAYQDQVVTHFTPNMRPATIVPVTLPSLFNQPEPSPLFGSREAGASNSVALRGTSLDRVMGSPRRKVPMGISLFHLITLREPDTYMKQVRGFISRASNARLQDAATEAVQLFNTVTCKETLMQIESCLRRVPPRDTMDLRTDGAEPQTWLSSASGSIAGGPIGLAMQESDEALARTPEQVVNISDCSSISVGPTYHFHVTSS